MYANMHKAKKREPTIPKLSVKWTNQDDFEVKEKDPWD
jgi:hypothetical protein